MTHNDIYTKFMIEYDKANITSSYPSLTQFEIATILDKAYLALIAQKLTGNNPRKATFESDVKAIEDIRPLIKVKQLIDSVSGETNMSKNEIKYQIPDDVLYYLSSRIKDKINGEFDTQLLNHDLANDFRQTAVNYPWIKNPIAFLEDDDLHILVDPDKFNQEADMHITYIQKPKKFVVDSSSSDSSADVTGDTYYNVYVKINGNGTVSGAGKYKTGTTVKLIATPAQGSTFMRWECGENTYTDSTKEFTITSDITYTAVFLTESETKYTISISNDSSKGTVYGAGSYYPGDLVTIRVSSKSGYLFDYLEIDGLDDQITSNPYTFTPEESLEFIVHYKEAIVSTLNYSVSATSNPTEGGYVSGTGLYKKGDTVKLTVKAYTGYTFSGWSNKPSYAIQSIEDNSLTFTVSENVSVIANFTKNSTSDTYTVSFKTGTFGTGDGEYKPGDSVTLLAVAPINSKFSNWILTGAFDKQETLYTTNPCTFTMPNGDVVAQALFTLLNT